MRSFRFGVVLSNLPCKTWVTRVRQIEKLGYSSLFWPDHFRTQWEPTASLAAAAAVTKTLRIGSLVYCVDFRHPLILAKAAATIQVLSGGRHEFGIGAGWMERDYVQSGINYDPPKSRIERLDEALEIIRRLWARDVTNFAGRHFQVKNVPRTVTLSALPCPRILVGGGGKALLKVATHHADIVGIAPTFHGGKFGPQNILDFNIKRMREKVNWVKETAEAAGRNPNEIEFLSQVFGLYLTDDPKPVREEIAKRWAVSAEEIAQCGLFLVGSATELQKRLERTRAETGITYIAISESNPAILKEFAHSVVRPLLQK